MVLRLVCAIVQQFFNSMGSSNDLLLPHKKRDQYCKYFNNEVTKRDNTAFFHFLLLEKPSIPIKGYTLNNRYNRLFNSNAHFSLFNAQNASSSHDLSSFFKRAIATNTNLYSKVTQVSSSSKFPPSPNLNYHLKVWNQAQGRPVFFVTHPVVSVPFAGDEHVDDETEKEVENIPYCNIHTCI